MIERLSHLNSQDQPRMVDVSMKPDLLRRAEAHGFIKLNSQTLELITASKIRKGNVLTTAELAGIQAAKQTANLIPLCHSLPLSHVEVECHLREDGIEVKSLACTIGKTGVEMEALTAVSVALLTIYDMVKAVDKSMQIHGIKLVCKEKLPLHEGAP